MRCNKIVVATDKDGLSTNSILSSDNILLCPMADGGEGSMGVMERAFHRKDVQYEKIFIESVNHLGSPILAPVLMYKADGTMTAFIEMASVCGLNMIPRDKRNLLRSTTYGLGSVMRSVIESHGARRIVMAIGGSGTNDGGFGMLAALGWSFSNSSPFRNKDIPTFISGIDSASDRSVQSVCPHLKETEILVASDVTSPLLGPSGATAVYGPQKGCKRQDIPLFENALENWIKVIGHPDFPGAGAAGGTGYALKAALGAQFVPGWRFFASALGPGNHWRRPLRPFLALRKAALRHSGDVPAIRQTTVGDNRPLPGPGERIPQPRHYPRPGTLHHGPARRAPYIRRSGHNPPRPQHRKFQLNINQSLAIKIFYSIFVAIITF